MPNTKRGFGSVGIIIIILLALGVGAYFWSQKSTPSNVPTATNGYFSVPELGIKFKTTDSLRDLVYVIQDKSASFSTQSLVKKNCTATDDTLGSLRLISKDKLPSSPDPNVIMGELLNGPAMEKASKDGSGVVTDIGLSYVLFTGPQATCSGDKNTIVMQSTSIQEFRQVLKTILPID